MDNKDRFVSLVSILKDKSVDVYMKSVCIMACLKDGVIGEDQADQLWHQYVS